MVGLRPQRYLLGLVLGLAIGVLLLVITSILLNQPLFGITWTPTPEYFLKIDLAYLYLKVENVSNNTPLLGGKTLIWYVAIVRIENPYNNTILLENVKLHLPEQVYINCRKQGNMTATVTISARQQLTQNKTNVLFDSWINKSLCAYGFTNDLLRDSAARTLDHNLEYWINGRVVRDNHLYIVITGVTELPSLWRYRLRQLQDRQCVILIAEGRLYEGEGIAQALKITTIILTKIGANTYVYNKIPKNMGFDLEGTPEINTFYNGFWP